MNRQARSLVPIFTVFVFALILTLSISPIPLGKQSGGAALADTDTEWEERYILDWDELITNISAVDDSTAWLVATHLEECSFGASTILKTKDAGNDWEYLDAGTPGPLLDIVAIDGMTAWAVGEGTIIKTDTGGTSWTQQLTDPSYFLWGVSAVDSNTAWAVGSFEGSGPLVVYYDVVLRTTNGGSEWSVVYQEESSNGTSDVCATGEDTAWVPVKGGVLHTDNGGLSWEMIPADWDVAFSRICCLDEENIWVLGCIEDYYDELVVYSSDDGGATWEHHNFCFTASNNLLMGLEVEDCDNAWVVSGRAGSSPETGEGFIWRTEDGGLSWDRVSPGFDVRGLGSCAVMGNIVLFGGMGFILKATGSGITEPEISSVAPDTANQFTWALDLQLTGTGFQPGAAVRLEKGAAVLNAYNISVVSADQITCTIGFFGVEPGVYDVVVTNPGGGEARLPGAFTVTSACGTGSSNALLMLGLSLGLLSLAGTAGMRRRRKRI